MTKSLVEADGTFVQAFSDDATIDPSLLTGGRSVVASAPDAADAKWNGSSWIAAAPTPDELFTAKIVAGLQIVSTATPALNGTYPLDMDHQAQITGIVTSLSAGKGLPGNLPVVPWPDVNGDPHNFSASDIVNLGKAMEDYIFALSQTESLLHAQQPAEWPSQPMTIV